MSSLSVKNDFTSFLGDHTQTIVSFLDLKDINSLIQAKKNIYSFMTKITESGQKPIILAGLEERIETKNREVIYSEYVTLLLSERHFLGRESQTCLNIFKLDLSYSNVNNVELAKIIARCPNLTHLNLSGSTNVGSQGFQHLSGV